MLMGTDRVMLGNWEQVLTPSVPNLPYAGDGATTMLARVWRGVTPAEKADEYADYLRATGLPEYRAVEGNRGIYLLRRITQSEAEFVLVTLWDSIDAVRRFAGPDIVRAVYSPEDSTYLLALEPTVTHYEVLEP